jgi:hypothetical protein
MAWQVKMMNAASPEESERAQGQLKTWIPRESHLESLFSNEVTGRGASMCDNIIMIRVFGRARILELCIQRSGASAMAPGPKNVIRNI